MTDAPAVRFRDVTRRFGEVVAVDNVSFDIARGELVTLLGPSGCGKTTTLRLVAGLELASEGQIEIGGHDVTGLSASQRDVAMVFQSYALFPHMTVEENVAYGLKMSGFSRDEIASRVAAMLETVGLGSLGARMPSELSGGQQQRVAVARAVVLEPDVLLFDEPLSNLDAKLRRHVRDEIRDLQSRLGLTALYVTHDQEEALAISDRIVLMKDGAIAQSGEPSDLYDRPRTQFVADFIGDANILEGEVLRDGNGIARIRLGNYYLRAPRPDQPEGPASLAVRPQNVELDDAGAADGLAAKVARTVYLGSRTEIELDTSAGPVRATMPGSVRRWKPGVEVKARFPEGSVIFLEG